MADEMNRFPGIIANRDGVGTGINYAVGRLG
jgi:hypothetical protein